MHPAARVFQILFPVAQSYGAPAPFLPHPEHPRRRDDNLSSANWRDMRAR